MPSPRDRQVAGVPPTSLSASAATLFTPGSGGCPLSTGRSAHFSKSCPGALKGTFLGVWGALEPSPLQPCLCSKAGWWGPCGWGGRTAVGGVGGQLAWALLHATIERLSLARECPSL